MEFRVCSFVWGVAVAAVMAGPAAAQQGVFAKPDVGPKLIPGTCGQAVYPKAAEQAGHEGTVELVLTVTEQGLVVDTRVAVSSKSVILDSEARYIASQCRFRPALKDGKPVWGQIGFPFAWKLENPPAQAASAASATE